MSLPIFIKEKRKLLNLTQQNLADKVSVGIRFIRDLEQGKSTLRMDKVNQVLNLFGQELGLVSLNKNTILQAAAIFVAAFCLGVYYDAKSVATMLQPVEKEKGFHF
ncbi:helix-turn-helix transcriptional regulator [Labilibaculum sp.]|uniref:helix-turn-helix transcriptional regulator n=1 Tax=Labilibaculum sp. TaxID=2060723 RepID=UPI0035671679